MSDYPSNILHTIVSICVCCAGGVGVSAERATAPGSGGEEMLGCLETDCCAGSGCVSRDLQLQAVGERVERGDVRMSITVNFNTGSVFIKMLIRKIFLMIIPNIAN